MSNYTVVYFSCLKRGFSIPSTLAAFNVGGHEISIQFYGVIIAAAFILSLIAVTKLAKHNNMDLNKTYDMTIWGTLFGIVGARLMYVAFSWSYYSQHLSEIWKIRDGGLAIYGGIIIGTFAAWVVSKIVKADILDGLDLAGPGFLLGQAIGRWGNFMNQESFGTNTDLPWGMTSDKIRDYIISHQDFFAEHDMIVSPDRPVHPTFLYESLWCLIGFFILYFMFKNHRRFRGQIILSYCVWYGLERLVVEGIRTDALFIGGSNFRISQMISAVIVIAAAVVLIVQIRKHRK